MKYPFTT